MNVRLIPEDCINIIFEKYYKINFEKHKIKSLKTMNIIDSCEETYSISSKKFRKRYYFYTDKNYGFNMFFSLHKMYPEMNIGKRIKLLYRGIE